MNRAPAILLLLGAALSGFGWWGMGTRAGRRMFDEMAGMIPLACLGVGVVLLIVGVALATLARLRT